MNLSTPPLYAVDGRHVEIPDLEAEYLSGEPPPSSPDLRLVYLFREVERLRQIVRLTAEVRSAQKAYFADRTTAALTRSKALERELDRLLSGLTFREPAQTSLFGGPK